MQPSLAKRLRRWGERREPGATETSTPRESRPPHLPGGSPSNGVALLKQRLQMRQQSTLKTNWAKLCTPPRTLSQSSEGRILTQVTHGHRDGTRLAQCLDDQRAREGTHSIVGIALHGPPAPDAPGGPQRWQATRTQTAALPAARAPTTRVAHAWPLGARSHLPLRLPSPARSGAETDGKRGSEEHGPAWVTTRHPQSCPHRPHEGARSTPTSLPGRRDRLGAGRHPGPGLSHR